MIKILILLVTVITTVGGYYTCAQASGRFKDDDDFRSYYTCSNHCDRREFCSKTTEYYSSIDRVCKETGLLWFPAYDLNGIQEIRPYGQYRYFQQSNFDLYWSSETKTHHFTFTARYINETNVVGTETILSLQNKCVLVRDVQLSVRGIRSFCSINLPHPFSMNCDLPPDYVFSGCINY